MVVSKQKNLKRFKNGQVIFHEKDKAESLYIVQKGQVRLFLKKGEGYVDLGLIKVGEVIGEMGYFDSEDPRRSCSASAIGDSEVIEITYESFKTTMKSTNPWIQLIISTLVERMKSSNEKIKKLESNSVGYAAKGKGSGYKFYNLSEVIKILSTIYLVTTERGKKVDNGHGIHLNDLNGFLFDIYNVKFTVFEEFVLLLEELNILTRTADEDNLLKFIVIHDLKMMSQLMSFLEAQRLATDEKAVKISDRCQMMLEKIVADLDEKSETSESPVVSVTELIKYFDEQKVAISEIDLTDSNKMKFTSDIMVSTSNESSCEVDYPKLKKALPAIKLLNAIKKANESRKVL